MSGYNIDAFERSIRSDAPMYPNEWDADWDEPTDPTEYGEDAETDDMPAMPYPDEPWDDEEVAD